MAQSITIKIGGIEYPLVANSPEVEQLYRLAAEDINKLLAKYDERYGDKSLADKLAFVSLQEAVSKITNQRKLHTLVDEVNGLNSDLQAYLDGKV